MTKIDQPTQNLPTKSGAALKGIFRRAADWVARRAGYIPQAEAEGVINTLMQKIDEDKLALTAETIALRKLYEAERQAACTDSLTGLGNRRAWEEELVRVTAYAKRVPDFHVLVFTFDLDKFKQVNDNLGHTTGDNALKAVAGTTSENLLDHHDMQKEISDSLRKTDFVYRVGGDEYWGFAIITAPENLTGAKRKRYVRHAARLVLEKIRQAVADQNVPIEGQDNHTKVTISIGGAMYQPWMSLQDLISAVDRQAYRSKKNGRNSSTFYATPEHRNLHEISVNFSYYPAQKQVLPVLDQQAIYQIPSSFSYEPRPNPMRRTLTYRLRAGIQTPKI